MGQAIMRSRLSFRECEKPNLILKNKKEQEKEKKVVGEKTQSRISNPNSGQTQVPGSTWVRGRSVVWAEDHGQLVPPKF